jgi:translation elongation factor P/translation initiation factor 5A
MATIGMGDLKKGIRLEIDGQPYRVVEYQHVKPGRVRHSCALKSNRFQPAA